MLKHSRGKGLRGDGHSWNDKAMQQTNTSSAVSNNTVDRKKQSDESKHYSKAVHTVKRKNNEQGP